MYSYFNITNKINMSFNLMRIKILIIILLIESILSTISSPMIPSYNNPDIFKMSMKEYFNKFLSNFSNETSIGDFKGICENKFNEIFDNSEDLIELWFMSGQFLNDWGSYLDCVKKDRLYIQIRFNMTTNNRFIANNYIGFCFIRECKNFTRQIFSSNESGNLVDYFLLNYNISINPNETKFYTLEDHKGHTKQPINTGFKIFLFFIVFYFVLKLAISVLGLIIFRKNFSKYSESFRNSLTLSKNIFDKKIKSITYRIYTILSLRKALRYLVTPKTRLYNDNDIDKFLHIKYFSLIGINLYTLIFSFIGRIYELETLDLRKINYFFLMKLGYYSFNLYILIVGMVFSYKLLSYMTNNKDTSFKSFVKFYLICFSRFFVYFVSAFVIIYFSKDIFTYFGNLNILNDSYNGMFKSSYDCFIEPLYLVIPLYMNYFNLYEKRNYLVTSECNATFLLISSEFYVFTICTFLFYLIYKFKNRKFEIIVCIIPFLILFLLFLRYSYPQEFYSNAEILFGIRKVLTPHSLFVTYFIGIIIGVIFYINNNSQVLVCELTYIPLKFLKNVNIFLNRKPLWALTLSSYILIFFAVLISCNFEIIQSIYAYSTEGVVKIPFDFFLNIVYIFEHKIFIFFISLYLILLIHRHNHSNKDQFFRFIAISRSSYCIILSCEFISNLLYMKSLAYENKFFSPNLFKILFFLFGNFLLTCLIGIFMQISFETPFRILIKKYTNLKNRSTDSGIN